MTAGDAPVAYRERTVAAGDGLSLYCRDYGDPRSPLTPVLCLSGVTRNSKDFAQLAPRLAAGRRVLCLDYRGRGRSEYDTDWRRYTVPTYVDDVRHLLIATGIHHVHVIGTSLGGIVAMAMAVAMPGVLAGAVLNDVGPEIGTDGLGLIVDYMRDDRTFTRWEDVAGHIRETFPFLPAKTDDDWLLIARNTYRARDDGTLVRDWDAAIVRQFERALTQKVSLWPLFMALRRVPVLAVRGALSKILSTDTLRRMAERMPAMVQVTVEDCGHPPSLSEPNVQEAIDAHLARA